MSTLDILIDDKEYQWAAAEVVSTDYGGRDRGELYTIRCKILNTGVSGPANNIIRAKPLHSNIKQLPIIGEIVMVCLAPTPRHSAASFGRQFYYTHPVSIQSSIHHNGLPGANRLAIDNRTQNEKANNASDGIPSNLTDRTVLKDIIDPGFPERLDVYPIQPYSGDIILEGRWGQSIRFGSTVDTRRKYPIYPTWGVGLGATGNPITIISNGTNPSRREKTYNEFHIESPDNDDSSIWLTSGQSVRFTPSSTYEPSMSDKQISLFRTNSFSGNQVIIAADRIIFNAKKQEIIGYSKEGIGFSTEKSLALNGKKVIELESERISLGIDATSPSVLGDKLMDLMTELCDLLQNMNRSIRDITVPTSWGPSGTPINGADFVLYKEEIKKIQKKFPTVLSKFIFLNEKSKGPTDEDKNRFESLKANSFVYSAENKTDYGDSSGKPTLNNATQGFF